MDECWREGDLQHLLDSNQLAIYTDIFACEVLQYVIEASRKIGKSHLLAVIAFEAALHNPGKRINYAAPSGKEAVEITQPIMSWLAEQAPPDVRPQWRPSLGHWIFPNAAFIVLFGADDTAAADRGRGPESILNIVDEGGFCPVLFYLLESVLAPQTLQTQGRTIIASTPPVSPGHDFADVADNAARLGAYVHRDIYSHGRMSRKEIDAYLTQRAMSRGLSLGVYKLTTDYRREYGAMRVLDDSLAVVPEFPRVKEQVVADGSAAVRPPFFSLYFAGDPGMDDLFGGLWAYHDFKRNKLVVEHELLLSKANTKAFADAFTETMAKHYGCAPEDERAIRLVTKDNAHTVMRPHMAVLDDTTGRICSDLHTYHGLAFSPAPKDDREAAINLMRLEVGTRLEIHPRCVQLIRQLGTAVRKKPGGDMARNSRDGHYDLVSSLWYLCRIIDWTRNPFPMGYGVDPKRMAVRESARPRLSMADVLGGRKRR